MAYLSSTSRTLQVGLVGLAVMSVEQIIPGDTFQVKLLLGLAPRSPLFPAASLAVLTVGLMIYHIFARRDYREAYRKTVHFAGDAHRIPTAAELTPGCKANFDAVERNLDLFFEGFEHPAFRKARLTDYTGHFITSFAFEFSSERLGSTPEEESSRYLESASRAYSDRYPDCDGKMVEGGALSPDETFACDKLALATAAFSLVKVATDELSDRIRDHARHHQPDLREAWAFRERFWREFGSYIQLRDNLANKIDFHGTTIAVMLGVLACIAKLRGLSFAG